MTGPDQSSFSVSRALIRVKLHLFIQKFDRLQIVKASRHQCNRVPSLQLLLPDILHGPAHLFELFILVVSDQLDQFFIMDVDPLVDFISLVEANRG